MEIQRTCERAGDGVLTQMEPNYSEAAPEAQMPPAQDMIAKLEDKIAEHRRKEEMLRTEERGPEGPRGEYGLFLWLLSTGQARLS